MAIARRARALSSQSIRRLLLTTALSGAAVAAHAQSAPAASAPAAAPVQSVQEIVVTGSRIRGVAPVGSSVQSVTRQEITALGAPTTNDILQTIPQVLNYGITASNRLQNGGSNNVTWGSSINIRGIGPFATLTLVDGHRVNPQGTTGFAVDPSVIPTIGLERVEVVADGASAIYGSDAIAGVANLILRRNFEGLETTAQYGTADNYNERVFGAIAGHRWNSGQLTIAYESAHSSNLPGPSRPFADAVTAFQGGKNLVTQCNPGTITVGGQTYAVPATGLTAANASALAAGTSNKCDNLKQQDLLPEQNRNSADFTFNQTVNDWLSVFADGIYSRRNFRQNLQPVGANLTVLSTNPYFVLPAGVSASSETVGYSFAKDFNVPPNNGYSETYSITLGVDVKLPFDWKFEGDYMVGRDSELNQQWGGVNTAALNAALASKDPTVAFNPFAVNGNPAAVLKPILVNLVYQPGLTYLQAFEAKADGPLFSLPGGEVRGALGYEGQRFIVTQGQDAGTILNHSGILNHRYRQVDSFYGEALIPIVGEANAMPGIRKLTIDVAGRSDRYSDVGSTANPKVGVNWTPVDDLTIHGSYGTSFRAPTISQIYGNSNALFVQNYADPTNGGAPRAGVALSGGNLGLKPETATTFSIGGDYTPKFLPNSKFTLTYFNVDYENQVANYLANLNILGQESLFAGTGIIVRNPSTAFVQQLLATYPVNAGVVPNPVTLFIDGRNFNLGKSLTQGIDFDFSYKMPTDRYGDFGVGLIGTYLTGYKFAITTSAPELNLLNTIQNPIRFRTRGNVNWQKDGFAASLFVNYLNAYTNNLPATPQTVSAYTTADLHLSYSTRESTGSRWLNNIRIGIDVTNLFDARPPFVNIASSNNGTGGYDANLTNPIGRMAAFSISKKW
ncbi:MAG: TonB-dependent receptor plug domain-containing protein [Caulobacteraceae bacterium]